MLVRLIKCDRQGCKVQQQLEPATVGAGTIQWIEVRKTTSDGADAVPAGVHHFCCERCLSLFLRHNRANGHGETVPGFPAVERAVTGLRSRIKAKK